MTGNHKDTYGGIPRLTYSETFPGGKHVSDAIAVEKQGDGTYRLALRITDSYSSSQGGGGDPTGDPTGGSTGDSTGGPNGDSTGGPNGDSTGGPNGDSTGGPNGDSTGGPNGDSTGGPNGDSTGGP